MGVDAQMMIKVRGNLTQDDIKKQSYIFGQAFRSYLFIGHGDKIYHKPLEVINCYEQDGDDIIPEGNETFIEVPLNGRYYGIGYERGPLLIYVQIAEFLERLFPDCKVYYGGDSSGICAEPFDAKVRDKLINYYITNLGRDKYHNYFSGNHSKYTCPHCDMPMNQNGFKGKLGYFTCLGCGWNINEINETEIESGFEIKMF